MLSCVYLYLGNHAKQSTDAMKTVSKSKIPKTIEALVIWLVIKLLIKLQKSQQQEKPREKYISPEPRQVIINDLRLKEENYWWSKINIIMEYQKMINLLDNTPNQPTKCRTKN